MYQTHFHRGAPSLGRGVACLSLLASLGAELAAQDGMPPPAVIPQQRSLRGSLASVVYVNTPGHPRNVVPGLGIAFRPGGTSFTAFERPHVSSDDGHIAIEAFAATGSTADDNVLLLDGALLLREGAQAPWAAAGETVGTIDDSFGLNAAGQVLIGNNTNGTASFLTDDYSVLWSGGAWSVVAREGGLLDPLLPALAGGTWDDLMDTARLTDGGAMLWRGDGLDNLPGSVAGDEVLVLPTGYLFEFVDVPANQANAAVAAWENFDPEGVHVSADGAHVLVRGDTDDLDLLVDDVVVLDGAVVVQEGQPLPGAPFPEPVDANGIVMSWLDHAGNWYVRGNNDLTEHDWVVRNGVVVARSRGVDPIRPGYFEYWDDTAYADCFFAMDGNSSGAYVIGGVTDGPPEANGVLVYDDGAGGRAVIAREGDAVDLDGNGMFDDDRFFNTFGNDDVLLLESGDVLFTATLRDGAGVPVDQGVFRVTTSSAAMCTPYLGSGINATGFSCQTLPVLGGVFTVDTMANASTTDTFALVSLRRAQTPVSVFGGEVLIDPDLAVAITGFGTHSFSIPSQSVWIGLKLFLQGGRVDVVGGVPQPVVMNALEVVLGT